jgi:hypothetical protein
VSPPVQYRNPSPPPSPEPIQLQYVTDGTAGPVYALQLGPSLQLQPLQQRLVLADQLREALGRRRADARQPQPAVRYESSSVRWPDSVFALSPDSVFAIAVAAAAAAASAAADCCS